MNAAQLDERSKGVLRTLIQLHVATGEPVGSENVCRAMNRSASPATIRNIMSELERHGYLDHPHTSAGRVPTDEGYRVYVDSLMPQERLSNEDVAAVIHALNEKVASPEQVVENASQILSRLSRNVGFVLAPDIARATFMQIDLVRLPHPRILVVMVSRTGLVTNKVIEVEEPLSQDELRTCANYLSHNFNGMSLAAIRARLLEMMREEKAQYDELLQRVVSIGERAFTADTAAANVYIDGTSTLLEKPEFDDVEKMRALFRTFEEKNRLVRILNECISGDGLRIFIGHENPNPDLHRVALVTAGYPVGDEPGWGVGVVGSTRMDYARVVALVEHVSRALRQALQENA